MYCAVVKQFALSGPMPCGLETFLLRDLCISLDSEAPSRDKNLHLEMTILLIWY